VQPFEVVRLSLEVASDPRGVVAGIAPASLTEVDPLVTPTLAFTVTLLATAGPAPIVDLVVLELVGDGQVLDTVEIPFEIAPL
jgi:hypothetical protein